MKQIKCVCVCYVCLCVCVCLRCMSVCVAEEETGGEEENYEWEQETYDP